MADAPPWLRPAASASGPAASRVQSPAARPHWLQPLPTATVAAARSQDERPSWLRPSATAGGRHPSTSAESRSSGEGNAALAQTTPGRRTQSHEERPSWLQPSASAKRQRPSWLQPGASAESSSAKRQRPSWLQPSATSTPDSAAPVRARQGDGPWEADSAPVRKVHLDMACVLMADETLTVSTTYSRNAVDPDRIRDVLRTPCGCAGAACKARSLCIAPVTSFLQRFHALSVESKALMVSTAYDTAGPRPEDRVAQVRARMLACRFPSVGIE